MDHAAVMSQQAAMSAAERLALLEDEYGMELVDDEVHDVERLGDKSAAKAEEQAIRKKHRAEAKAAKEKETKTKKPAAASQPATAAGPRQMTLEETKAGQQSTLNFEAALASLRQYGDDTAPLHFDYQKLVAAELEDELEEDDADAAPFDMSRILGFSAAAAAPPPPPAPPVAPVALPAPVVVAPPPAVTPAPVKGKAQPSPAKKNNNAHVAASTAAALQAPDVATVLPPQPSAAAERNFKVKVEPEVKLEFNPTQGAPVPQAAGAARSAAAPVIQPNGDFIMYWTDAREQPHFATVDPGSILLFGKTKTADGTWRSCCLRVTKVQRCVMALPKPNADELAVVNELNKLCRDREINQRRIKQVERWYAFEEEDTPREKSTWYKLKYDGSYRPLLEYGEEQPKMQHIVKLYGANRSLLELFLIKRNFMGPDFIRARGATQVPDADKLSHCDIEMTIADPKAVNPAGQTGLAPPPLTAMSIQLHAQLDHSKHANEIFGVSLCFQQVSADRTTQDHEYNDFAVAFRAPSGTVIPYDFAKHCQANRLPNVRTFGNEYAMLVWLTEQIRARDPDLLVGHNFLAFTLDVLLHRMQALKIPEWSLLGRLKLRVMPKLQSGAGGTKESTYQEREVCVGRLIVDTYLLAREHHRSTNYKLTALALELRLKGLFATGAAREEQPDLQKATFNVNTLFDAVTFILHQSILAFSLSNRLDFVPLTKVLCSTAGNLWSRTLTGSRSERIEYLLLHNFHRSKFVTPDKRPAGYVPTTLSTTVVKDEPGTGENPAKRRREFDGDEEVPAADADGDDDGANDGTGDAAAGPNGAVRRKAKYKGGMVLEPKTGLYKEYILLLDFNSLYPSIIQEFDICFTTIKRRTGEDGNLPTAEDLVCAACKTDPEKRSTFRDGRCLHRCILPRTIAELVNSRREVKKLMATERDPSVLSQYEIRQKALKLTANSMYGCLGFEHSRFYAQKLAELVTEKGREALGKACALVESVQLPDGNRLDVVYGDTDSVMIRTQQRDLAKVREIALRIRSDVNKTYKKLEIGIDGVFCSMLLHTKKKYAALVVEDFMGEGKHIKREVKGLDMVRRDWCGVTKMACSAVLDCLLDHNISAEDAVDTVVKQMRQIAANVRSGKAYELSSFCVSKSLTRDPEAYKDLNQPHVQVALRMKARNEQVRSNDLIPYIICNEPINAEEAGAVGKLANRAYHVNEVKANSQLTIDVDWYLATQILPPVMRLCEHVDGFTMQQMADCMDIKLSSHHREGEDAAEVGAERSQYASSAFRGLSLEDAYPLAIPFHAPCRRCHRRVRIHPHERVHDLVQALTSGNLASSPDARRSLSDSGEKAPIGPKHRFRELLYHCVACKSAIDLKTVTLWILYELHKCRAAFYAGPGDALATEKVRQQLLYYRALFDVPRHIDRLDLEAHQNALRLWDPKYSRVRALCDASKLPDVELLNPPLQHVTEAYEQMFGTVVNTALLLPRH